MPNETNGTLGYLRVLQTMLHCPVCQGEEIFPSPRPDQAEWRPCKFCGAILYTPYLGLLRKEAR